MFIQVLACQRLRVCANTSLNIYTHIHRDRRIWHIMINRQLLATRVRQTLSPQFVCLAEGKRTWQVPSNNNSAYCTSLS